MIRKGRQAAVPVMGRTYQRFLHLENKLHHQFIAHSIAVLRVAVGAVFLGFGLLKYFPGVSPAQNLAEATSHLLFFGLVPGRAALIAIATLECAIGVFLIVGKPMRVAIWLLAAEFVGILSPVVLLSGRLFAGPHHAPTLEGQYVLKDVILVGAAMVIAAASFRGGRLVRADLPPSSRVVPDAPLSGEQKLDLLSRPVTMKAALRVSAAARGSRSWSTTTGVRPLGRGRSGLWTTYRYARRRF